MITLLVDHDIEGHALLLWGTLGTEGWFDLAPMRLVRFAEVGLSYASSDREVWRFAQTHSMFLLTNNRNMEGVNSLEQTIREENTPTSLPVITIGRIERMAERLYREDCAAKVLEIVLYPANYLGVGRLFVP